ncbi:MAG: hypothetical protein JXR76_12380 [Deltaproteobacteria bacterium]|nr:hypothetical protein [Deltaproteobacteria bacterium]
MQSTSVYANIPFASGGTPEDPVLWYSGGQFHMIYSYPLDRIAYHLTALDAINNRENKGVAFQSTEPFLKYEDGTVNIWTNWSAPWCTWKTAT